MPILIPEDNPEKLIREDGKRLDGRALDELRPFKCKIGVLENAEGSSYVEHGGNKIYAGVFGPREVHPRHLAKPDRGILMLLIAWQHFLFMNVKALPLIEEKEKYLKSSLKLWNHHYSCLCIQIPKLKYSLR